MTTTTETPIAQSAHLTLQNSKHSKGYFAELVPSEGGLWSVNFSYGPIGAVQKPGTKTASPVPYEKALKIYEKLLSEKTGKPCDCCGACYTGTYSASDEAVSPKVMNGFTPAEDHPGFFPELLRAIIAADAESYINDPDFGCEEKFDGERMAVSYLNGEVVCFNRKGKAAPAPQVLVDQILAVVAAHSQIKLVSLILDGEWLPRVGEFVAFDILGVNGAVTGLEQTERYDLLTRLTKDSGIRVAELVLGSVAKRAFIEEVRAKSGEGVVFKLLKAPYMPGREGHNVKLKFWESATVRVCAKRKNEEAHSFGIEVYKLVSVASLKPGAFAQEAKWVNVGNVTCKGPLPAIGTLREVKYLYVGVGGNLYQPEDLGARTDVTEDACSFLQLKHKRDDANLA